MITVAKCVLALLLAGVLNDQQQPTKPAEKESPASTQGSGAQPLAHAETKVVPVPADPELVKKEAWTLLSDGSRSNKSAERAGTMHALGLLSKNGRARRLAEAGLQDHAAEVRVAAAAALGEMHARASRAKLQAALDDKDLSVSLAAAHALISLKDDCGYDLYYEALTGERKAGKGPLSEVAAFKDPKKLAALGFHEGIGFIPFGDIGWQAYKVLTKDDSAKVRAAAAIVLANDPDPTATEALINAAGDKNWVVRAAALEALARRGNPSAIDTVQLYLADQEGAVKYMAAGAVLRLLAIKESGTKAAAKTPAN